MLDPFARGVEKQLSGIENVEDGHGLFLFQLDHQWRPHAPRAAP
jgi:hypothetical protein